MPKTSPSVCGIGLDPESRCAHYATPLDVVAIKMRCCGRYYACRECHNALADHPATVWPRSEWHIPAVRCGVCETELTIAQYLECASRCPACGAAFNPGCRNHHELYFEP